jgi:tetratricopeptide (TPR) repeat protein
MKRWSLLVAIFFALAGLFAAPARADFSDDQKACNNGATDPDVGIPACTRQVASGRFKGHDLAITFYNRGNFWNRKSDYDHAIADYDQALQLDPNYGYAYGNRGRAWYNKDNLDKALADLNDAIRINPQNAIEYNSRGNVWKDKGDLDKAMADYNQAIHFDNKFASAYYNRGAAWGSKGNDDRAMADYDQAIKLDPNYGYAYGNRGRIWYNKNNLDKALADLNEAIRINPRNSVEYNSRGNVWRDKKDPDRAIADYNLAIQLDPKDAFVYNNRGNAWTDKGNFAAAIADYGQAIAIDPAYTAAFTNRGLAYEKKGDTDSARADYNAALAVPEKYSNGKWAHDTATKHLASLPASTGRASASRQPSGPVAVVTPPFVPQVPLRPAASGFDPGRRVALVIGNSSYSAVPQLPNPRHDSETVADALRRLGFKTVTLLTDLTREKLIDALRKFARDAENADWALVYYAGHGIEMNGTNYLIPIDAKLEIDRDVEFEAIPLSQVMSAVEGAKKMRLVMLDACRDNPFAHQMRRSIGTRSVSRGLAAVEPEAGTLVVYAAKDGQTALDGDSGNSPFVSALVKEMTTPGLEIRKLFDLVRDDVLDATHNRQQPFTYGSVSGREDFFFAK